MESNFDQILSNLEKKQEKRDLLKILIKIRKEVEWPRNVDNIIKLRTRGYLKHLVRILHMPQKPIIDVSLSILGNCMLDRDCARDAIGTHNILTPLGHLLVRYPKEDSIIGRILRIIANVCTQRDQWANIIIDRAPQFVTHTVDLIKAISKDSILEEDKYCEATVVMALRTLRLLTNSRTLIPLVKDFGVLKIVGSFFIKLTIEWQETKNNGNLLYQIIRLFHEFSRFKYYNSINELRSTERGDTFLYLCNVLLLYPKRIVKIIMNFMKICQYLSELPIPEICDRFIQEVTNGDQNIQEFKEEYIAYIQCLCHLLSDPSNRTPDRCGKCLHLFIKVLDAFDSPSAAELESCTLMITTLISCRFDCDLVRDLVRCKIIETLVNKLKWLRGAEKGSPAVTVKHSMPKMRSSSKRSNPWPDETRHCRCLLEEAEECHFSALQGLKFSKRPCFARSWAPPPISDDYYLEVDRSPSPSSSSGSDMSGFLSPFGSPNSTAMDGSDSDSDNYSPVCSEADSEEFSPAYQEIDQQAEEDEPSEGLVVSELVENEESPREQIITENLKGTLITEIAKLINAYAGVLPPLPELASEELLIELVNCSERLVVTSAFSTSAISILSRIIRSTNRLVPLMKTTVIEKIYSMKQYKHGPLCVKCEEDRHLVKRVLGSFTEVAQTEMCKGEIAHALLRGSKELKEQMVLTIPYIVEQRSYLVHFFLSCDGLDVLMRLIEDGSPHKDRALNILCILASKLISTPNSGYVSITDARALKLMHLEGSHEFAPSETRTVTFKLDDGSYVRADRDLLTQKSEYFASLLSGGFKESSEDEVALHDVKNDTFSCILLLLEQNEGIEQLVIRRPIHTLLDAIVLADRYVMTELCNSLICFIKKYKITSKTVATIYRWSHESGLDILRVESVWFALVQCFEDHTRKAMFNELFRLGYTDELIQDIRELLNKRLKTLSKLPQIMDGRRYIRNRFIRQKSLIVNFFLHCEGLDVLMRLIENGSPHKDRALKVLCILASKRLCIANPCYVPLKNVFCLKLLHLARPYQVTPLEERTVTFKLDDGSYVRADRNLLTQKSEYFASLLSGNFKESSEDEVALHNVENDTLMCILHLLKHTGRIERLVVKRKIHTLLDAIVVADRYLLTELCNSLVNCIEKHRMTSKTVAPIYRWSHESGLNMLRVESVAFALVQSFDDHTRNAMFSELFRLGYTDELIQDIRELLHRHLNTLSKGDVYFSE